MKISKLCCQRSAESNSESRTPVFQRFSCGIGGILCEITSQILSFRLVFFMNVLGLSATNAGWLVVYGKISQAFAQPLCAFLGNRIKIPFLSRKLGRKKSWHFIGTTMITIVLPLYFAPCFPCQSDGGHWQLMMYILALSTVASTSISLIELGQLSIIPVISKNQADAIELNAWRQTFQFLSGVLTYLVAWAVLGQDNANQEISPESSMDFTVLTTIMIGIGFIVTTIIFHGGTKEPSEEVVNSLPTTDKTETDDDAVKKSSFIPPYSSLQSMTYMAATDLIFTKETMRDWFIDSMKTKGEAVVQKEGHTRKKSFARHFINAMFVVNEKEKNEANEVLPLGEDIVIEAIPKDSVADASISSSSKTQIDDSTMLQNVKDMPPERKISILKSIFYELTGLKEHLPTCNKEETKAPTGMNNSNGIICTEIPNDYTEITEESLGTDNEGHECDEIVERSSHLGQRKKTSQGDETFTNPLATNHGLPSEATKNNESPSFVSTECESAVSVTAAPKTVRAWLKDPRLYLVATIFSSAKVLQDFCFNYLPLFLVHRVQLQKAAIAYLPLIMLISGATSSVLSKKIIEKMGGKWSFILSTLVAVGAGLWFYFITESTKVMTYPAVVLLGFGFSIMMVNSLNFAAELIGDNKSTCGVVFAVMGLMSRAVAGTMFLAIQKFFPQGSNSTDCEECGNYVRHLFSFVPGSLAVIGVLALMLFQAPRTNCKRNAPKTDTSMNLDGTSDTRL